MLVHSTLKVSSASLACTAVQYSVESKCRCLKKFASTEHEGCQFYAWPNLASRIHILKVQSRLNLNAFMNFLFVTKLNSVSASHKQCATFISLRHDTLSALLPKGA